MLIHIQGVINPCQLRVLTAENKDKHFRVGKESLYTESSADMEISTKKKKGREFDHISTQAENVKLKSL